MNNFKFKISKFYELNLLIEILSMHMHVKTMHLIDKKLKVALPQMVKKSFIYIVAMVQISS